MRRSVAGFILLVGIAVFVSYALACADYEEPVQPNVLIGADARMDILVLEPGQNGPRWGTVEVAEVGFPTDLAITTDEAPDYDSRISFSSDGDISITCDGNDIKVVFNNCEPMDIFEMLHKAYCPDCKATWKGRPDLDPHVCTQFIGTSCLVFGCDPKTCEYNIMTCIECGKESKGLE